MLERPSRASFLFLMQDNLEYISSQNPVITFHLYPLLFMLNQPNIAVLDIKIYPIFLVRLELEAFHFVLEGSDLGHN